MNQSIVELQSISKGFPGVQALDEVNFRLYQGEVHAIAGENGAGKSTLIKILSGAYSRDSGVIQIDGRNVISSNPHIMQALGIQTMYQERNLIPGMTVAENVLLSDLPASPLGRFSWKKLYREAEEVLSRLSISIAVDRRMETLSSAEQQLVEIARALSRDSRVLIMDEPTSSLNEHETEHLFQLINSLKQEGLSIIYISHHLDELFQIADRITVLRDGETVGTYPMADMTKDSIIRLMVGEKGMVQPERPPRFRDDPVLTCRNLSWGRHVDNVSFSLHSGEILCFTGMVGAGRTELAQLVMGVHQPDSGKIVIHGNTQNHRSPKEAIESGLGYLPEERKYDGIIPQMSVKENITLAGIKKITRWLGLSIKRENRIAGRFQDKLSIATPSLSKEIRHLSGGNQQKTILAKWLFADTDILILDEPTKGVDVGAKQEIYGEIRKQAGLGKAIWIISSDLEEVIQLANRVLVMNGGRIVADLVGEDITSNSVLHYGLIDLSEMESSENE